MIKKILSSLNLAKETESGHASFPQHGMTCPLQHKKNYIESATDYLNRYQFSAYRDEVLNLYHLYICSGRSGYDIHSITESELLDLYFMLHDTLFENQFQIFEPNDVY